MVTTCIIVLVCFVCVGELEGKRKGGRKKERGCNKFQSVRESERERDRDREEEEE